jgi:CRP-like cAMP-binding protein
VFEVFQDARRVALRSTCELIGEIAFFACNAQRTASVRALTDGRLLVLRRKFLQELTRSDPDVGYEVVMTMSRVMAERIPR